MIGFFCVNFAFYFFITWFPTYLIQARGFSLAQLGTLGLLPGLVSIPCGWLGGFTSDALYRGDDGKAIAEFQKEIESNPSFSLAYYRLGDAYENRGAWDDAISTLQRSIWLNPNHSGPYTLIGKAY